MAVSSLTEIHLSHFYKNLHWLPWPFQAIYSSGAPSLLVDFILIWIFLFEVQVHGQVSQAELFFLSSSNLNTWWLGLMPLQLCFPFFKINSPNSFNVFLYLILSRFPVLITALLCPWSNAFLEIQSPKLNPVFYMRPYVWWLVLSFWGGEDAICCDCKPSSGS